jgi:RimJ/RimL family protein N-acetyltransferase
MMTFREGVVFEEFEAGGKMVVFRALKKSDLKECLRHINALIREKSYIASDKEVTPEAEKVWLKNTLEENRKGTKVTVVVESGGKMAGIGEVWKGRHQADAHKADLAIGMNAEKGKGVGYRLMMALERLAAERLKCEIITFCVYEENTVARKLYAKCGYREAGRIPRGCRLRGKYYDELIMVKDIG